MRDQPNSPQQPPDRRLAVAAAIQDAYARELRRLHMPDPMTLAEARRIQAENEAEKPYLDIRVGEPFVVPVDDLDYDDPATVTSDLEDA